MGKLGELAELCHELNSDDFHVFFEYSGHVSCFALNVHMGGWVEDSLGVFFSVLSEVDEADGAIDWLKEKHAESRSRQAERAKSKEQNAKALEEAKALLTPEQIKIIKELA